MTSSPWKNIPELESTILENMCVRNRKNSTSTVLNYEQFRDGGQHDLESDAVIALQLQQQFDEENKIWNHTLLAKRKLKIPISVINDCDQRVQNLVLEQQPESEEEENINYNYKDWDESESVNQEITKYDISFYNDGEADFRSNGAVKKIKKSSKFDEKLYQSIVLKLDEYSKLQLNKMIQNQMLRKVNEIISRGDEVVILHGEYYSEYITSEECLLKVVFTTPTGKSTKRSFYKNYIRKLRTEKDMMNHLRLNKAGILCPEPIGLKNNVLIMSFTGKGLHHARTLKDSALTPGEYRVAYNQVVKGIHTLFTKTKLIYTNLSERNILYFNGNCYVLDVSQVIEVNEVDVFRFLMKDCKTITNFFRTKLPDIKKPKDLFIDITGFIYNDKLILEPVLKTPMGEQKMIRIRTSDKKTTGKKVDCLKRR